MKKQTKKTVKKTSKKIELGKKIQYAKDLIKLESQKKAVYNKLTGTTIPASFYLHMHFINVVRLVDGGYLFVKIKQ